MKTSMRMALAAIVPAVALSGLAQAHPGHGDFLAGVVHPLGGADHLLAMITAGVWASRLSGRAKIMVPAAFVASVGAGTLLSLSSSLAEAGILVGLMVLGLGLFSQRLQSVRAALALMLVSGVFHGAAHVADLGAQSMTPSFLPGMLLSTLVLQGVGLGLGTLMARRQWTLAQGWGLPVAGFALLSLLS
jgi:urease accessory protein